VGAYAGAIAWLLQDPELRSRMGRAGRERVERYFSWDRHIRILERAIRSAAGEMVEVGVPGTALATSRNGSRPLPAVQPVAAAELAEVDTQPLVRV
jgi:hypothetical protein